MYNKLLAPFTCAFLCLGHARAADLLLYVPFDSDARAAVARGKPEPKIAGKLVLRDGLVGKAAVLVSSPDVIQQIRGSNEGRSHGPVRSAAHAQAEGLHKHY